MANIVEAFHLAYRAGLEVSPAECPETAWSKWMKSNARLCTIVKGELCTFVKVEGLNYLTDALHAFKASPEYAEMRDLSFSNYKLYVAYANDFKIA